VEWTQTANQTALVKCVSDSEIHSIYSSSC